MVRIQFQCIYFLLWYKYRFQQHALPEIFTTFLVLWQRPTAQIAGGASQFLHAAAAAEELPEPTQPWRKTGVSEAQYLIGHNWPNKA